MKGHWAPVLMVLLLGPLAPVLAFTKTLPEGVPTDLTGWEKIVGEAELDNPRVSVRYEFYVNPLRPGLYELIRYRITHAAAAGTAPHAATEKLQWQAAQKDLRRFECEEEAEEPCRWRELERGGLEYRREVAVILWLYGLHRRLLEERDRTPEAPR